MEDYKLDFKYMAIRLALNRLLHVKTPEALLWRRRARRYLENFPFQWKYQKLLSWFLDDEVFDQLQRDAQKLEIENFLVTNQKDPDIM